MNLYDYLIYHQKDIVFSKASWNGVRALKNPLDAWVYQEIIFHVEPDIIVEIGSYVGGSTSFFASLLDVRGKGRVLSVDIDDSMFELKHPRVVRILGDSRSTAIVEQVHTFCKGQRTLIVHDGDHRCDAVLADLRNYADLVSLDSYFIVEDGIVDLFEGDEFGWDGPGPLYAVEQFLAERSDFEVDESAERYILTYNPKGFLRRTKPE
jgi:cephalosporin hydroxylase